MSNTVGIIFLICLFIALQLRTVLAEDDVNCNSELQAFAFSNVTVSENFPSNYPNNVNCRTHIRSPEGTVIELHFHTFSLEDSTECEKDALVVFDGIDGGARLLQHSCGSDFAWPHYPDKVVSTGNGMTLEFITDSSGTSTGYNATYQAVDPRHFTFVIANPDDQRLRVLDRRSARNLGYSPVDMQFPLSVDYDPISKFIYYSDENAMNIGRVSTASSQSEILHSKNVFYPFGLRLDVVSRLLYWTDALLGTVSVSDLEGRYRLTIIANAGLQTPGSIVTEPHQGFIYFTDRGSQGKIWKAEADGSNLESLVNKPDFRPQGLAIDLQARSLYWVDTVSDELQMITVDGSNNSATFHLYNGVDPFAIALDEDAIFFTDMSRGALRFYDRNLETDGSGIIFVGVSEYRGLTLRPSYDFGEENPYACSSSPCDEICLPKPKYVYTCQKVYGNTDSECLKTKTVGSNLFINVLPKFTSPCPTDILMNATSSIRVTWSEPTVTSPQGLGVGQTQTHHPGQYFDPGAHLVNYDFEDTLGNKISCAFYVLVIDPLGFFCPDDIEVLVDEGEVSGTATWHEPVNSLGERATFQSHFSGGSFPLGRTIVTYIFEDSTDVCNFAVTITQYHQPTDVFDNCPDPILMWIAPGQTSATVTWDVIQLGNPDYQIVHETETPGSVFYVGTEKVSILAVGPRNHKIWCNFTVTVQVDNIPPEIIGCPGTITRVVSPGTSSVEVTWIEPSVSDNSGRVYWESTPAVPGSTFYIGSTNLTYVARDGYGNTAVCQFHIIVVSPGPDDEGIEGKDKTLLLSLAVAIPSSIIFILLPVLVIIIYRRRSRRPTQGGSHPSIISGGPVAFTSAGEAVNFPASHEREIHHTYDVIDNTAQAIGPPPPYREKY